MLQAVVPLYLQQRLEVLWLSWRGPVGLPDT